MNRFFLVLLLAVFFFGCAHKGTSPSSPVPTGPERAASLEGAPGEEEEPSLEQDDAEEEEPLDPLDPFDDIEDEQEEVTIADPLFYWNKAMFQFNDKLYFWLLKPVATGYKAVLPEMVRIGIRNFFHNLGFPVRFVGAVLQNNGHKAQAELARFMFNSFFGVLGFGNPAKDYPHLNPKEEDLGQAFGKWGIGDGFYIVWPLLGPSTARDTVGSVGEIFLNPVSYAVDSTGEALAVRGGKTVNSTSFRLGDYEAWKKAALDPYVSMRNGYVQDRRKSIAE